MSKLKTIIVATIKEALEYSSGPTNPVIDLFEVPEWVKGLSSEVESLDKIVNQHYENGNYEEAEKIDAILADKIEKLESAMDEIGFEGEKNTGSGEEIQYPGGSIGSAIYTRDLSELMKQLATIYYCYKNQYCGSGYMLYDDLRETIEVAKRVIESYSYHHGGLNPNLNNNMIWDALKYSFDIIHQQKEKYKNKFEPERQELLKKLFQLYYKKYGRKIEADPSLMRVWQRQPIGEVEKMIDKLQQ